MLLIITWYFYGSMFYVLWCTLYRWCMYICNVKVQLLHCFCVHSMTDLKTMDKDQRNIFSNNQHILFTIPLKVKSQNVMRVMMQLLHLHQTILQDNLHIIETAGCCRLFFCKIFSAVAAVTRCSSSNINVVRMKINL